MAADPITYPDPDPDPSPGPGPGGRTPVAERLDRVHRFAGRVNEVLDGLGDPHPVGLSGPALAEALVELERAAGRISGLALRLLAQADRDNPIGSTGSTKAWLRSQLPVTRRTAAARTRLAATLDQGHEAVDTALVAGSVLPDQATVICAAVDALPTTVGVDTRRAAEAHLLDLAERHDADELRRLGCPGPPG